MSTSTRRTVTLKEVSVARGIPESTLRYYRARGEGPKSWKLGRRVVYFEDDVDAWIEAQYAKAVGEAVAG